MSHVCATLAKYFLRKFSHIHLGVGMNLLGKDCLKCFITAFSLSEIEEFNEHSLSTASRAILLNAQNENDV